jgi:hypothetical protein
MVFEDSKDLLLLDVKIGLSVLEEEELMVAVLRK